MFVKNDYIWQKITILVVNQDYCQISRFWPEIVIIINQDYGQKSRFYLKIVIHQQPKYTKKTTTIYCS